MVVDIIVPVYNVSKYLNKCIESLLAQTYKYIKIILVDDGSTDGSEKICDNYARIDDRINVIHKENGGLVSAWTMGIKNSKSEWVVFVDGDDWVEYKHIELLVKEQIVSTATLLYPILTLNIVDAVMRFLMDKESDKKAIASIGLKYVSISSVLFGFIMLFFYITGIWSDINGLEGYIFSYYISYVINQFFIQFAKGLEKVKNMGVAGVLSTIVTIIANLFFLLVIKWGLIGFFLANILAQIVSAIYLFLKTEIYNYIEIKRQPIALRREMLIYSVPLIATVVGWWVNSCADKYIVTFILGISANGLLSVSYKIPQIINTIQGIFTQAWQISAIKEYGSSDTADFYGKTFIVINLMMCIVCSFLIFMTRPLAYILYANDFYEAWKYVPFLLVSSVLNCASGLLGPILSAKKNSKAMMWSAIVGAVANIIMNIVFVNLTGIQGATFATLVSSYIIYIIRKYAVGEDIYINNYYVIIVTWLILVVQGIIESNFMNYYLEILCVVVIIIINKNSVWQVLNLVKNIYKNIK